MKELLFLSPKRFLVNYLVCLKMDLLTMQLSVKIQIVTMPRHTIKFVETAELRKSLCFNNIHRFLQVFPQINYLI